MSTRDISAHLEEIYGVQVGRDLISRVTDAVMDDARAWQQRPLEDVYPIVFLDCMVLKIRDGGSVQRKACYLALGVTLDGDRDVLGMGAKIRYRGWGALMTIDSDTLRDLRPLDHTIRLIFSLRFHCSSRAVSRTSRVLRKPCGRAPSCRIGTSRIRVSGDLLALA